MPFRWQNSRFPSTRPKGDFIGREPLKKQFEAFKKIMDRDYSALADLPYRIQPIYLEGKGVLRKGFPVYSKDAWSEESPSAM